VQSPDIHAEDFATMSRPEIVVKEKWSRQLDEFAKTGVEV